MSRECLVVIDPACHTPELACYNYIVARASIPVHYHLPAIAGFNSLELEDRDAIKGAIILGSKASVYDQLPWQEPLHDLIKTWGEARIPLLGICYGHQAIAHTFGGTIGFHSEDRHKFIGFREIELSACSLSHRVTKSGPLFYSHCEIVTVRPPKFIELARSQEFSNEALQHQELPIWSFQGHIEAIPSFVKQMGYQALSQNDSLRLGHWILDNFLELIRKYTKDQNLLQSRTF